MNPEELESIREEISNLNELLTKVIERQDWLLQKLEATKQKPQSSEFVSRSEAAQRLRCSVRTIDRFIKDEELRTKKIGGSRLIYKVSLEAFIETCN